MKKRLFLLSCIFFITCATYAEPPNISLLKQRLYEYYTSGAYLKAVKIKTDKVKQFIEEEVLQHPNETLALVLDIDETSLSNVPNILAEDFTSKQETINRHILQADALVIEPVLDLYNYAKSLGMAVFFVTGRSEIYTNVTEKNLMKAGFKQWSGLYMRPSQYHEHSIIPFKSEMRASIEKQGYRIVATIGDQRSDILGGHAVKGFKLPNPYYYLP